MSEYPLSRAVKKEVEDELHTLVQQKIMKTQFK